MYHARVQRFIAILFFLVVLTACKSKNTDLRARIAAANTSQFCHPPDACINPSILAFEKGYTVTAFVGGRPQYEVLHLTELREHLLNLPMSAWPQGPIIGISTSDDVTDWQLIQKNVKEAEKTCRSLGLEAQFRPGG